MKTLKRSKPATPQDKFYEATILLPHLVADVSLDRKFPGRTPEQREWFVNFVEWWVRFFHANNPKWKRFIESNHRNQLYVWTDHWAEALALDPEEFIKRHQEANAASTDFEWMPGGLLTSSWPDSFIALDDAT